MRMRNKKHGHTRLLQCGPLWVQNPQQHQGAWNTLFGRPAPLHVEIGCGKGGFLSCMARQNPDINFVALEQNKTVFVLAAEKAKALALPNVRFVLGNAKQLNDYFAPGECDRIYLNFSDPWHKKKHHKRRLTHASYLDLYKTVLSAEGDIHMKTDNTDLFEFSLASLQQNGFAVSGVTYDLHSTNIPNVLTEYEALFAQQGKPICRLVATRASDPSSLHVCGAKTL